MTTLWHFESTFYNLNIDLMLLVLSSDRTLDSDSGVINKCDLVMNIVVFQKHEFEFESELTSTQHVTHEKYDREVETTLPLDVRRFSSRNDWTNWMSLPIHTAEESTQWEVKFGSDKNDVKIGLQLNPQQKSCSTASVRLLATVVDDCCNWTEIAVTISDDEQFYYNKFPKQLSEFGKSTKVHIRVRWTLVELLPCAVSHLMNGTAHVLCRWRLCGLNTVRPTAEWWHLYSEPFDSGAIWRMCVIKSRSSNKRQLKVGVDLQHICEEAQQQQLQWSCTLTVFNKQFQETQNMEKFSMCGLWLVVDDVDKQPTDTLDLQVFINITHRQ